VVGFVLTFLAGYGNTLHSTASAARVDEEAGQQETVLASFGAEPQRDKALGMHRMVSWALQTSSALWIVLGGCKLNSQHACGLHNPAWHVMQGTTTGNSSVPLCQ
jgi:hypothetical protein